MIPGSNLLAQALNLIASQPVTYYRATGRTTTGAGRYISTFAPAAPQALGSVQAVPRDKFQVLGLELERDYIYWYVPADVVPLERDISGDQIEWNGDRWQLVTSTWWYQQDGWTAVMCVKITGA